MSRVDRVKRARCERNVPNGNGLISKGLKESNSIREANVRVSILHRDGDRHSAIKEESNNQRRKKTKIER